MTIKQGESMLASDILNLTFFPKGTILMYDGQLWDRTGGIPGWHICDGIDGTINLTDKFIRGGTAARQTGGIDTAQVPYHTHSVTESNGGHSHVINDPGHYHTAGNGTASGGWSHVPGKNILHVPVMGMTHDTAQVGSSTTGISINKATVGITVNYTGSQTVDNRPAFCTVIFIEKITNYLA
jgi:hypothetical protein